MRTLLYHQKAIEKWGYRNIFFVFKCHIKFSLVIFDPKNYDFLSVSAEYLDNLSKNLVKKTEKKNIGDSRNRNPFLDLCVVAGATVHALLGGMRSHFFIQKDFNESSLLPMGF